MDKFRELASIHFHKAPDNLNCAQSVAKIAGRDDLVPGDLAFGGGRAEGGICGALFAALQCTPEENHEKIKEEFAQKAGALTCREIKGKAKTPCSECVAVGAFLADKYQK
ncbi:MAG: redox-active protein [Planctomycetia bacterium]|nr:redox-active protein [Planctomycetia bacterium]